MWNKTVRKSEFLVINIDRTTAMVIKIIKKLKLGFPQKGIQENLRSF